MGKSSSALASGGLGGRGREALDFAPKKKLLVDRGQDPARGQAAMAAGQPELIGITYACCKQADGKQGIIYLTQYV